MAIEAFLTPDSSPHHRRPNRRSIQPPISAQLPEIESVVTRVLSPNKSTSIPSRRPSHPSPPNPTIHRLYRICHEEEEMEANTWEVSLPPEEELQEPVLGPSKSELIKTRELEKLLTEAGLYESQAEEAARVEVLGRIDQTVKLWIKSISRAKGFNEEFVQEANAKIFTFGSYRLGVNDPGADIDTLCAAPRYASREEDFFKTLHSMLANMPEVTELHSVPDAYVPVMKFKFSGVSIDLL